MTEPTNEQIEVAALKWCGDKNRETFSGDLEYFRRKWRALPGLRTYVERELQSTR